MKGSEYYTSGARALVMGSNDKTKTQGKGIMESKEWNEKIRKENYPWMNDDQFECFLMLCDLFHGHHHVLGKIKAASKEGIMINHQNSGDFATFDFNMMTRAVIFAHDRMIRFAIAPSGPGMLKLFFHKRHVREGSMSERHPTIEQAITDIRK